MLVIHVLLWELQTAMYVDTLDQLLCRCRAMVSAPDALRNTACCAMRDARRALDWKGVRSRPLTGADAFVLPCSLHDAAPQWFSTSQ